MNKKTFQHAPKPKSPDQSDIDQFISSGPGRDLKHGKAETQKSVKEDMVRLTVDLPRDLHRRYKAACSLRGVKMNEEIRAFVASKITGA